MTTFSRATFARRRPHWLYLLAALAALALGLHGAIPQWDDYHHFADTRRWWGVVNALDVLSNLPFAMVGLWALSPSRRPSMTTAWRCFALAVAATALGSGWYHLAPDNDRLAFDRLPIAWACAALTCAFMAERVDARWGETPSVAAALALASASVAWWAIGEHRGVGDLRPYLFVQFLPMLCVPPALMLKLHRDPAAVPDRTWWTVLALYATAKGMELADTAIFDRTGIVSGHTLKHLLAAAAATCLLRSAVSCGSRR